MTSNGRLILALDGEGDGRIDAAAHLVDGLVQGQALNFHAIDFGDEIIGHDAGLGGGRIVDRSHDLDKAVFHGDFDAEAAEFALGLDAHVLKALGIHVAGMGIERGEHAIDGRLDHLGFVGVLDIVGADAVEHVTEKIELLIGIGIGGGDCRAEGMPEHGCRDGPCQHQTERPNALLCQFHF